MNSWIVLSGYVTFAFYSVSGQFYPPGVAGNNGCPSLFMCPLNCQFGFVVDSNGCKTCACASQTGGSGASGASGVMNPGGDPFHQGGGTMGMTSSAALTSSPDFTNPCIGPATCNLECQYGYFNGQNGCQYCICASKPEMKNNYTRPCSGAAATCDLTCKDGYQLGPGGCQHCSCAGDQTTVSTTTPLPEPTTPSTTDECLMKITECQLLHPHGFMTDDECSLCIDKDVIYQASSIPLERQPMVLLTKPCIAGFDQCMIFCNSGYRTGPRDCQYCACNE